MVTLQAAMLSAISLLFITRQPLEAAISATNLRVEYRVNPLGIGTTKPRFSWEVVTSDRAARGLNQTSYRVIVATTREKVEANNPDLWDSGFVSSSATCQIEYAGKPLTSRSHAFWRVEVSNSDQREFTTSRPAEFSVGLLQNSDWKSEWIGFDRNPEPPLTAEVREHLRKLPWIKRPNPPQTAAQSASFRKKFRLEGNSPVTSAWIVVTPDQFADIKLNGQVAGHSERWNVIEAQPVTSLLRRGENLLTIEVVQQDGLEPAATGELHIDFADGSTQLVPLDGSWRVADHDVPNWESISADDSAFAAAKVGGPGWGGNRNTEYFYDAPRLMRNEFKVPKRVQRATLYSTALGVYDCEINGKRVGNDLLAPGWTDYQKRVDAQTYDVTSYIKSGTNAIGVTLGDGWYAGLMGFSGRRRWYGGEPRFKGQIEIEYTDGSSEIVASDRNWRFSTGPIRYSDLYMGAKIDARYKVGPWTTPGFDDSAWNRVVTGYKPLVTGLDVTRIIRSALKNNVVDLKVDPAVLGDPAYGQVKRLIVDYTLDGEPKQHVVDEGMPLHLPFHGEQGKIAIRRAMFTPVDVPTENQFVLEPAPSEGIRTHEEIRPKSISEPKPGRYIFDLGQNMVGFIRYRATGPAATTLTVRHAEMLNPDGTMYTSNLRGATAVDYFTLSGGRDTFEPKFTFHGFRYVEVTGLDHRPSLSDLTGVVIHSELARTGQFESSSGPLNQLFHNIIWGQKGNYVDVPTDCPQRDERLGWTGDAQFFVGAAAYNFDVAAFFTKWVRTLAEDSQLADGSFGHVAPYVNIGGGSTAWGDAAIVCTYNMFRTYGDKRIVAEHWSAFKRYMKWLSSKTHDGITDVGGFGDWLNLGDPTDSHLIDTAYRVELTRMMAEMANGPDKALFERENRESREAFVRTFVATDGSLRKSGQTGYALAFTTDLIPPQLRKAASDHFVETLRSRNWHLSTGFIGTPRLLPSLHAAGRDDVAYRLMLQDSYPSWLYQVKLGATTMWERWNGFLPDKGFADVGMNSFNHYAFGSVGQYLFRSVGGINPTSPNEPIILAPQIELGLDHASASYDSIRGRISVRWQRRGGQVEMEVSVPVNANADLTLPTPSLDAVRESGESLAGRPGVEVRRANHIRLQSGTYRFSFPTIG